MTEQQQAAPVSIPVHVESISTDLGAELSGRLAKSGRPAMPPNVRTVYRTVTLTAQDQAQELMAASDDRLGAQVIVVDADIFIGENKSDVAAGRGAYIPCAIPAATKPSLSAPVLINDRRVIYAAPVVALAGASVIRITVIAAYRS